MNFFGHICRMLDERLIKEVVFGIMDVSNLNGYRDMKPGRYPGHVLDLLWSRDVISHVPIHLPMWGFLQVVSGHHASIWHG